MPRYVSLKTAHKILKANPLVSHILVGPPGIGKTKGLSDIFPSDTHIIVIVDAANSDVGDTSLPHIVEKIHRGEKISMVEFVPAMRYGLGMLNKDGKPMIPVVVIDEIGKAPGHTIGMFNRVIYDRMVGDTPLPPDAIVVGTSNSLNDGLGDNLAGHTINRVCILNVRPPTESEWVEWAELHGIHPILIKFASYRTTDGSDLFEFYGNMPDPRASTNNMVFNPHLENTSGSFVSPRSLAQADNYFRAAFDPAHPVQLDDDELLIALEGLWGAPAANAFQQYLLVDGRSLPTLVDLHKDANAVLEKLRTEIKPLAPLAIMNLLDQVGREGQATPGNPLSGDAKEAWIRKSVADLEMVSKLMLDLDDKVIMQVASLGAATRSYAWSSLRHNEKHPARNWAKIAAVTGQINSAMAGVF